MADAYINNRGNIDAAGRLPAFKYTGRYSITDKGKDGETRNWEVRLSSSGTFTALKDMEVTMVAEATRLSASQWRGKSNITLSAGTTYDVRSGTAGYCQFGNANFFRISYERVNGMLPTCYIRIKNA